MNIWRGFELLTKMPSYCCSSRPVFLQNMTDKCFNKCITKPGGDLSNSERVRMALVHACCSPSGRGGG